MTSEETQEPSAPAEPSAPPSPSPAPAAEESGSNEAPAETPQVDYNRLLDDDDYEPPAPAAAEPAATPTPEPAAQPAAEAVGSDPDPVVETIIVEGVEHQVRKSEQKALLQKGRYMERRFERIAPLLAVEREAPELIEAWRDPEARRRALESLRASKSPAAAPTKQSAADDEDDLDERDRAVIDRRAEKRARELLERAGIKVPEPADVEAQNKEQEWARRQVNSTLEALRMVDPDFDGTMNTVKEMLGEMERSIPREQYVAFRAAVDNPRNVHPTTGRPLFVHLIEDAKSWKAKRAAGAPAAAPATPAAKPAVPSRPTTITATLEPGSPSVGSAGRPSGGPDFQRMSPTERKSYFDRLIDGE